jgi:hypothetical protein
MIGVEDLLTAIERLPGDLKAELAKGPLAGHDECRVCRTLKNGGGKLVPADGVDVVFDYHEIGVYQLVEALDGKLTNEGRVAHDTWRELVLLDWPEPFDTGLRQLAGALSAERCLLIYALCGWERDTRNRIPGLVVYPERLRADVGLRSVKLAPMPMRLLERLERNAGELVPLDDLWQAMWEYVPAPGSSRALAAQIGRLRRALGNDVVVVEGVHGRGYVLRAAS